MELIAPEWEVEMKVKSYNATFVKSSGEERTMNFVRNSDLPSNFLDGKVKNQNASRNYTEGRELVWDLDSEGFRTFNWETVVGQAETAEIELS
jgi:hypothetical protein